MIKKQNMTPKMLGEYEAFEPIFAKGVANSISLYILGAVPLLIASAVATKKLIELGITMKKFKNGSK